jgi:N-acetylmuramoyl-L-alanine amidase CwlA
MEIKTKACNPANCGKTRDADSIRYIVLHYTANLGDTAKNNADYFAREKVKASAHYFVDENEVWNSVPVEKAAWHCGGDLQGSGGHTFHGKCTNANSIGVEICMLTKNAVIRKDSIRNTAKLVRRLMAKYHIDADHVIRHFDVTGKQCPAPMVADQGVWDNFKVMLTQEETEMRYKYYDDMPDWAKPTIAKLVRKGLLKGDCDGAHNLSEDALKVFVVNDRAGLYGE